MQYFLLLIIAALCWAGYFEYFALQKQSAKDQQEIRDELGRKIDKLEADNQKLTDDLTALKKQPPAPVVAAPPAPVATIEQPKKEGDPMPPPKPALPSNNLGNVTTSDGKTYASCRVLKVDTQGITISSTAGITKIRFLVLPPDLQKRFGFDPQQGVLTQAQADAQEAQVQASAAAQN